MKNRTIVNMQDIRDLVLDTLAHFAREHDTEGIAEHLQEISSHDGIQYHGVILDQGDETLVTVQPFWTVARRYHHATIQARGAAYAGPHYQPPRHVSPTPTHTPQVAHAHA